MSTDSHGKQAGRMSRRAFLRGTGFLGGAAVLVACGGSSTTPGTGGTAATSAPAQADGVITITQWYHQYGEEGTQKAAQSYADEYSKVNPKVKIDMQWIPGDYDAKLSAALL